MYFVKKSRFEESTFSIYFLKCFLFFSFIFNIFFIFLTFKFNFSFLKNFPASPPTTRPTSHISYNFIFPYNNFAYI